MDIQNKEGQYFNVTHNLNSTEVLVDITGKRTLASGEHRINFGLREVSTPEWSKTYGGTNHDGCYYVIQTSDGGHALAGSTASYGVGAPPYLNAWLVKTDSAGNAVWNKTYGGTRNDYAYAMVQTGDGGYALAGSTSSYGVGTPSAYNFWLVKTDSTGNALWNRTYGGTNQDYCYSIAQTNDGGYALAGRTYSYGAGITDFYLVKTDAYGTMQWNKTYGGTSNDECYSVLQTDNGGYALAGFTQSYGVGTPSYLNAWLIKTDSAGNAVWNKTYGGTNSDRAYSLVRASDGGYALAGSTSSYGVGTPSYENFWLVKTDSAGNALWNQTYGGTNYDYCFSVAQAIDGGYALAGWTRSYGVGAPSYNNFYFVKTDSVGNQMSNQTYGGANLDYCYSAAQTNDGGYALAGLTYSYGAGAPSYSDVYLVKTEGVASGLVWVDSTNNTVTLYRGTTDTDWKYVRVRIWLIKEPTWIYGDINMDGVVDAKDLYILGRNYGKTFSLLSLTGIIAIAGIRTVKKRKQTKQPSYIN